MDWWEIVKVTLTIYFAFFFWPTVMVLITRRWIW